VETDSSYRVSVDIGGTFTDIVLRGQNGTLATKKILSTTDDYGKGIITGLVELLEELALPPRAVEGVVHGTTVATNAILEGKGARTALITTAGFRDVLELRRVRIPELYNLFYEPPPPLVPRRLRFEVEERMAPQGEIRKPLDLNSVTDVIEKIRSRAVDALAICLIHSYVNSEHERVVTKLVQDALPGIYVSCSADILPEIREYERTSTTVINAYIGPIVKQYLSSLLTQLRSIKIDAPLRIMQSNGGVMTAESAIEQPAHIVESGPAAGVIAAAQVARSIGYKNVITLDMGGTTAKSSIIENGELNLTSEYEVGGGINLSSQLVKGGGYALKLPFIDVSEIGAGGGSIVWIDAGGLLQIGPQSAGAMPGPACYDAGGQEPTLTDAHVVLGYINPQYLAGGRVRLNADKAQQALESVAEAMQLSLLETAYGVHQIASAKMMRAVKAVSTYRGRDPRDFLLVAFGGNGPVTAGELARSLQMGRVLIPPHPGLFSAFGLLLANVEYQFVQTYFHRADQAPLSELNEAYDRLEKQANSVLTQDGYPREQIAIKRYADLRYAGQAYELTVPVASGRLEATQLAQIIENFEEEHLKTYGHRASNEPVDVVNLRVTGEVLQSEQSVEAPTGKFQGNPDQQCNPPAQRMAYFGRGDGLVSTPVLTRGELAGRELHGPLIIEEYDATCVVPPRCIASLDEWGNIMIKVEVEK
jgi:N-methylhydantoinase A